MTTATQTKIGLTTKLGATEGIYLNNLGVFKIQETQAGYLFAKKLNETTGKFEGAPGAVNKIQPQTKMSLEAAKHYGKLYGMCMVCGRILTDETSISLGIGPICLEKF